MRVTEGTVYAKAGGQIHLLNTGEEMEFNHGHPTSSLHQDKKFAVRETREKVLDLKAAEPLPLALMDLNTQFLLGVSVNGNGLVADPTVSETVQSILHLGSVGIPPLISGLPQLNGTQLNGIHLVVP